MKAVKSQYNYLDGRALLVVEHLLHKNREEIERADGKASMLVIGALTTGALVVQWALNHVDHASSIGQFLVGVGAILWLTSLVLLGATIYPRMSTKRDKRAVTYFADVHHAAETSTLGQYVREAAEDRLSWLLIQVTDTSRIVVIKYRCLRLAICLLGGAGACVVGGIGTAM